MLLPCDCWSYSTTILGINKIEARKYQWLEVHLREAIKHLHTSMVAEEGKQGREAAPTVMGEGDQEQEGPCSLTPVHQISTAYIIHECNNNNAAQPTKGY